MSTMDGMTPLPEVGTDLSEGPVPVAGPMAEPAPAADTVPADDNDVPVGVIAGLLAAFGIGAAGFAAMRTRRRHEDEDADMGVTPPTQAAYRPVPVNAEATHTYVPVAPPQPVAAHSPARSPAPVDLGDSALAVGEDREQLLDRMVAAEPDSANPFRSPKARRKRARVILQHRDHLLSKGEPFDWRTYKAGRGTEATADATGREQIARPEPALV